MTDNSTLACDQVDCTVPECLQHCGYLQGFANLTNCIVVLQFLAPKSDAWLDIGIFEPYARIDLQTSALYLPRETRLRVIEKPKDELAPIKVLRDFGVLGPWKRILYLDGVECLKSAKIFHEDNLPESPKNHSEQKVPRLAQVLGLRIPPYPNIAHNSFPKDQK